MNERSDELELVELRVRPTARHAREAQLPRQWSRVAVVPTAVHGAEVARMRRAFPLADYAHDVRYVNPSAASLTHHHIPARVVQLGTVLDLTTVLGELATAWDSELRGWALLTDARAELMRPGAAALYLVRVRPTGAEPDGSVGQERTYEAWHKRAPAQTLELDVPDFCGCYLGHAKTIGYRSDKWSERDEAHDYEHDFSESGLEPEAWADAPELAQANGVVLRGGDMRITADGID